MDVNTFKKTVSEQLVSFGFEKKRTSFYKRNADLIYVVGLQKSKHSDGFYFNVGYVIKELHQGLDYPKDVDGDIRTRFSLMSSGREIDILELDELPSNAVDYIKDFLEKNISDLIDEVEENGIKHLLDKDPTLLYQTSLKAKQYLEIS